LEPYATLNLDPLTDELAEIICSPLLVLEGEQMTSGLFLKSKKVSLHGGVSVQILSMTWPCMTDPLISLELSVTDNNATRESCSSAGYKAAFRRVPVGRSQVRVR
jgi:hypothetical protein